jgi:hypothetical protein
VGVLSKQRAADQWHGLVTCCRWRNSSAARVTLSVPLSPAAGTTNCAVTVRSKVLALLLNCWDTRDPASTEQPHVTPRTLSLLELFTSASSEV